MANHTAAEGDARSSGGAGSARVYCSEAEPTEPLRGTTDTVDAWLCLEYRPPWRAKAIADNDLAEPIRRWLTAAVAAFADAGLKARPQFIRQPEREEEDTRLLVCLHGRTFRFAGRGYDFLKNLALDGMASLEAAGEELGEPQYLVCTNGQRDLCCARFGLPVYTALNERVGERAWQVTHLGGHRFAPNVLTFPDACLYGRVFSETVDEFVGTVESGRVDFPRLRGRSCYPPVVQAAEACLARQDLRLLHVEGDAADATVQFAIDGERVAVRVGREAHPQAVIKSCGEGREEVYAYVPVQPGASSAAPPAEG